MICEENDLSTAEYGLDPLSCILAYPVESCRILSSGTLLAVLVLPGGRRGVSGTETIGGVFGAIASELTPFHKGLGCKTPAIKTA